MTAKASIPADLEPKTGLPQHGATLDDGVVVRARSRGPGVAVPVAHPHQGPPRRVASGEGSARFSGGQLFITPTNAPKGQLLALTLEF